MSHPVPEPHRRKVLTGPLIGALATLLALAVATVIVVLNKDDDSGSGNAASPMSASEATTSAPAPPPSDPGENALQVTSEDHGVRYTLMGDGYNEDKWQGPQTIDVDGLPVTDAVGYEACSVGVGTDLMYGLAGSPEGDLASAAATTITTFAGGLWDGAQVEPASSADEKTTDGGITGQLVETSVTRSSGPDECGTTGSDVAAFAFEDKNGDVVVMLAAYRRDGDTLKNGDEFINDIVATMQSLEFS